MAADDGITALLTSDDDKKYSEGVRQLDEQYRLRICGCVGRRFPSLSEDDLLDGWADTLLAVHRAVREGRFRADLPLEPWLRRIAMNRAIDIMRHNCRCATIMEAVEDVLRNTRFGKDSLEPAECCELHRLIRSAIASLPPKQRIVLQCFVDGYPDTRRLQSLQADVSDAMGEHVTRKSVERALSEGRKKVSEVLRCKGYAIE